jgi:hypothetical protein
MIPFQIGRRYFIHGRHNRTNLIFSTVFRSRIYTLALVRFQESNVKLGRLDNKALARLHGILINPEVDLEGRSLDLDIIKRESINHTLLDASIAEIRKDHLQKSKVREKRLYGSS